MARLIAGVSSQGEFVERLTEVVDEVKLNERKMVLYIVELHTLIAGSSELLDASNILKLALGRGKLKIYLSIFFMSFFVLNNGI